MTEKQKQKSIRYHKEKLKTIGRYILNNVDDLDEFYTIHAFAASVQDTLQEIYDESHDDRVQEIKETQQ